MKVSLIDTESTEAIFGGYRWDGLYVFGPAGTRCALAVLIYFTYCRDARGTTPEAARKQRVVTRGRLMQAARTWDSAGRPHDPLDDVYAGLLEDALPARSGFGLYGRPVKPASSGRKRRAAA